MNFFSKKHTLNLLDYTLCLMIIGIACHGCSDDPEFQNSELPSDETTTIIASMAQTKLEYAPGDAKTLWWSTGDAFQLFNDNDAGVVFTLTSGAGTANGTFSGPSSSGMNRAIFPASATNVGEKIGYKNLMLPFYGQTQVGNDSNANLGDFNYLMAPVLDGGASPINFQLLAAQLKMELDLPESVVGNITKVELLLPPDRNLFVAELCPYDPSQNIMTHRQALSLSDVTLPTNRKLTATMMIAPTLLSNEDLTIAVTTDDGALDYYYVEIDGLTMNFEAGHQYIARFALEAVGEYYPTSSYTLSPTGTELSQWNVYTPNDQTIDMSKDIHLRRVSTIGDFAFAHSASSSSYYSTSYQWIQMPDALTTMGDNCFVFANNQNQKIAVGLGENASSITGSTMYKSFISWNVSKENSSLDNIEEHLVNKAKTMLKAISLPTVAGSTLQLPDVIVQYGIYSISTGTNVQRFEISQTVHTIDDGAFYGCTGMGEIVVPQASPSAITVYNDSFSSDVYNNTKLIVPAGSKAAYEAHSVWGLFNSSNIEEEALFGIVIPEAVRTPHMITKKDNIYTVDSDSYNLQTTLTEAISWTASSNAAWLTLSASSGTLPTGPTLQISANNTGNWRYAQVSVVAAGETQVLDIKQQPTVHNLPVVIHILKDGSSNTEGITQAMAISLVDSINNRYAALPLYNTNGVHIGNYDMNIRLALATQDPDGAPTTGVLMHSVTTAQRESHDFLNFENPMTTQDNADHALVWPQNRYINIFIFEFVDSEGNPTGVVGTSNLCLMRPDINAQYLGYFYTLPYGSHYNNVNSMFSVTLSTRQMYAGTVGPDITHDFVDTAVHELGHYLGLFHTFNDGPAPLGDDAVGDTQNYDRELYEDYLSDLNTAITNYNEGDRTVWATLDDALYGVSLRGFRIPLGSASSYSFTALPPDAFASTNIMDYYHYVTEMKSFTPLQTQRMRYAVAHSPMIPHDDTYTRALVELPFDPHPEIEAPVIDLHRSTEISVEQ